MVQANGWYPYPGTDEAHRWKLLRLLALGIVGIVWMLCWLVRLRYGSPNVDDYLYSSIARQLWTPLAQGHVRGAIAAFLHTGQTAPLVPALGAPLSVFGPDIVVLIQLPLLLVLTILVFEIVSSVDRVEAGILAALMTALAAPMLCWALMVHMAVLSSVCALAVVYFYLRSSGFARPLSSIGVGLSMGLLALSRSMSPIYVTAAAATMLISMFCYHRLDFIKNLRNVAMGFGAAAIVAGPWYWENSQVALSYLVATGYSSRSGFAAGGNPIQVRLETIGHEVGYALTALMALMFAVAVIGRLQGQRPPSSLHAREARLVLLAFTAFVILILSTSSVPGTAFTLPAIATFIPALVLSLPPNGRDLKIVTGAVIVVYSLGIAQAGLRAGWQDRLDAAPAPLYTAAICEAVGRPCTKPDTLTETIGRLIGDKSIFVARDDAVVNVNGLNYFKIAEGYPPLADTTSFDRTSQRISVPANFEFVLTGASCAPYHPYVDRGYLESSLTSGRWSRFQSWRVSACNDVVLWRRPDSQATVR